MKQLFVNGTATTLFFNSDDDIYEIYAWVRTKVLLCYSESESNIFNLKDQNDCCVKVESDKRILISSCQDYTTLTLEDAIPIKL